MTIGNDFIEQLGNGNPNGCTLGGSTSEKISFYGVTPIVQRSSADQASTVTTAAGSALQTTNWAFTTSTQPANMIKELNACRTAMVNFGIIAGA